MRTTIFVRQSICGSLCRMLPEAFKTTRLILRPIAKGDAPAIFTGYAQDPIVVRFLIWRPHEALSETEDYIARCMAVPPYKGRTYALIGRGRSQLLGAFELRRPKPHMLDFRYVLARVNWGRGLMAEALIEVVDWAMRQASIWRIGAVCDVENPASARVMEKAELQREGTLRRWIIHPNIGSEPRDCFSYAKIR